MGFFSNIFDFDNFDLGEIAMLPANQTKADFNFVKDVFSGDVSEAFGNHQDAMTDMQGSIGLNKDNKIVKNSDAIVGSVFAALGGGALAAGAGGGVGGAGAAGGAGTTTGMGSGIGLGSLASPSAGGMGTASYTGLGSISAPTGGATATTGGMGSASYAGMGSVSPPAAAPTAPTVAPPTAPPPTYDGGTSTLEDINQGFNLLNNIQGRPAQPLQPQTIARGAHSYQSDNTTRVNSNYGGLI